MARFEKAVFHDVHFRARRSEPVSNLAEIGPTFIRW